MSENDYESIRDARNIIGGLLERMEDRHED